MEYFDGFNSFWVMLLFLTILVIYLLPFLIAKKESPVLAIFLLNLFLGWTLIGWLGALIWGQLGGNAPQHKTVINQQPQPDKYDKLARLKHLLDSGAISKNEYNSEKEKILSGLNT